MGGIEAARYRLWLTRSLFIAHSEKGFSSGDTQASVEATSRTLAGGIMARLSSTMATGNNAGPPSAAHLHEGRCTPQPDSLMKQKARLGKSPLDCQHCLSVDTVAVGSGGGKHGNPTCETWLNLQMNHHSCQGVPVVCFDSFF